MNTATYNSLSPETRSDIGPIDIDDAIPDGTVRVTRDMPIDAFVRSRRAKRKRERQNKKSGRQ